MSARKLFPVVLAALAISGCFGAYAVGVKLHDAARIEYSRAIAEETAAFCSKFVNEKSPVLLKQCAEELVELRRRHEARLSDAFYSSAE